MTSYGVLYPRCQLINSHPEYTAAAPCFIRSTPAVQIGRVAADRHDQSSSAIPTFETGTPLSDDIEHTILGGTSAAFDPQGRWLRSIAMPAHVPQLSFGDANRDRLIWRQICHSEAALRMAAIRPTPGIARAPSALLGISSAGRKRNDRMLLRFRSKWPFVSVDRRLQHQAANRCQR